MEARPHATARHHAPAPVRAYRLARAALHVVEGLATTAFVFPFASAPTRKRMIQRWSRRLLSIFSVTLEHSGAALAHNGPIVIVANHISWLDIFVVLAHQPSRFIAKSEIRRWPVIGLLVTSVGTLYVDRTRRRDAARINDVVRDALASGDVVALFPEGTTTFGEDVLPFHGSLLQPVIDADGHVVPAAIRYYDEHGARSEAPAYVGDTSLMDSLRALVRARRSHVRLHLEPPFHAGGRHRREVAREARRIIQEVLERPEQRALSAAADPHGEA
jgi:1-acyl-sn-glycerol-3-phosphate acyltransferase